ncbi:MAG: metallophosphoesterase family protein, partial [Brevibacterium aurantiacum]
MRFVATGDWQLGMTAHYLSAEARPRFHRARLDAVKRIGEIAAEQSCEFVIVCGDVFESNQLDR